MAVAAAAVVVLQLRQRELVAPVAAAARHALRGVVSPPTVTVTVGRMTVSRVTVSSSAVAAVVVARLRLLLLLLLLSDAGSDVVRRAVRAQRVQLAMRSRRTSARRVTVSSGGAVASASSAPVVAAATRSVGTVLRTPLPEHRRVSVGVVAFTAGSDNRDDGGGGLGLLRPLRVERVGVVLGAEARGTSGCVGQPQH